MNEQENKEEFDSLKRKTEYLLFVEFMAIPKVFRKDIFHCGEDEGDFAKEYGLNQNTLTAWKRMKDFQNKVDEKLIEWGRGKIPDVISALYRTILKSGKRPEVELWLENFGGFKQKVEITEGETEESKETNTKIKRIFEIVKQLKEIEDKK
jgi:hypothetical protein